MFACKLIVHCLIASLMYQSALVHAAANSSGCLEALFQRAGLRPSHIPRYVRAFRSNGLQASVLYDLSFLDLVKLLQGKSFDITHAGDVFRLHTCVSNGGDCLVHPVCLNGGSCQYSDVRGSHVCKCTSEYESSRCETYVPDPVSKLRSELERVSIIAAGVGVTYTRWGRESCNGSSGAELVYNGYMAGQKHTQKGGASNYLCLPYHPEYNKYRPGVQASAIIYGAELQQDFPFPGLYNHDPACSVCHVAGRGSQVMIPAMYTCPPSWMREYHGYLMTEAISHHRTEYVCVDGEPDVVRGTQADTNGVLLHFVETDCSHGIDCGPYSAEKELACVVCTR